MTRRERKREREREGKRERKEERKEDKPATANITFNDKNSFFPTTLWSKDSCSHQSYSTIMECYTIKNRK